MRRRITRALVAAAATGATVTTLGLTAAGTASAATALPAISSAYGNGSPVITEDTAGYETSGRYFRYIQALITVPNIKASTYFATDYIQLANGPLDATGDHPTGDQYTRAGIMPCKVYTAKFGQSVCGTSSKLTTQWVGFIAAFNNSINSGPYYIQAIPLTVKPGDGVFFSIYYYQGGNELHYVIDPPPSDEGPLYFKTRAYGPIFDHADAVVDYTNATGGPVSLPPFGQKFRITQFLQGAVTTYRGNRGSFVGPWTTSKVYATTNDEPYPIGHVILSPSYLWGDGMVANGAVRWGDAFGVWARV